MPRDRRRQRESQARQERPVGADPIDERLGTGRGQLARLGDDDPERLPPPEFDQHRLTGFEIRERVRDEVRVRPVPAASGRIDRDLDGAPAAGRRPGSGRRRLRRHGVGQQGQGDRE